MSTNVIHFVGPQVPYVFQLETHSSAPRPCTLPKKTQMDDGKEYYYSDIILSDIHSKPPSS